MIAPVRTREKGKAVLELLKVHGPLSIELIFRMLSPSMKKKKLRRCLASLRANGTIECRWVSQTKIFYQLSQALPNRNRTAELLKCAPDELHQPTLSRQDWIHNEWSEYWIKLLCSLFPEADVIRERDISNSATAKRILLVNDFEFELLPDFMLLFPKSESGAPTAIAVEIERTRKSNSRIIQKLGKYANKTQIDGLIYVCDSGRLSETIRTLYSDKWSDNAFRIKHYSDSFFLFSDAINSCDEPLDRIFNAKAEKVSIVDWCGQLRKTKPTLRRNAHFAQGGDVAPLS